MDQTLKIDDEQSFNAFVRHVREGVRRHYDHCRIISRKIVLNKTITTTKLIPVEVKPFTNANRLINAIGANQGDSKSGAAAGMLSANSLSGGHQSSYHGGITPLVKTQTIEEKDKSIQNVESAKFLAELLNLLDTKLNDPFFFHNCSLIKIDEHTYSVSCSLNANDLTSANDIDGELKDEAAAAAGGINSSINIMRGTFDLENSLNSAAKFQLNQRKKQSLNKSTKSQQQSQKNQQTTNNQSVVNNNNNKPTFRILLRLQTEKKTKNKLSNNNNLKQQQHQSNENKSIKTTIESAMMMSSNAQISSSPSRYNNETAMLSSSPYKQQQQQQQPKIDTHTKPNQQQQQQPRRQFTSSSQTHQPTQKEREQSQTIVTNLLKVRVYFCFNRIQQQSS